MRFAKGEDLHPAAISHEGRLATAEPKQQLLEPNLGDRVSGRISGHLSQMMQSLFDQTSLRRNNKGLLADDIKNLIDSVSFSCLYVNLSGQIVALQEMKERI